MSDDYRRLPLMALDDIRCTPSALFHLPHWQPSAPSACMGCGAPTWCSDIMRRKGCRDIRAPLRPRVERKKTMAQDFGDDVGEMLFIRLLGRYCEKAAGIVLKASLTDAVQRYHQQKLELEGKSKEEAAAVDCAGRRSRCRCHLHPQHLICVGDSRMACGNRVARTWPHQVRHLGERASG